MLNAFIVVNDCSRCSINPMSEERASLRASLGDDCKRDRTVMSSALMVIMASSIPVNEASMRKRMENAKNRKRMSAMHLIIPLER